MANITYVKKNQNVSRYTTVGGVQIFLGVLCGILSLSMLFVRVLASIFGSFSGTFFYVMFFGAILAAAWLISCGARRLSLGDRYKKLQGRLSLGDYTLSDLSGFLGRTHNDLLSDLSTMKDAGFWSSVTVLDDCVVIRPIGEDTTYKIMSDENMFFSEGKKRHNLPYVVVLTILIALAFIFPLPFARWFWVVIAIVASIPLQRITFLICPSRPAVLYKKTPFIKPESIQLELSGNEDADLLIASGQRYLDELNSLNAIIRDEYLSERITIITNGTRQLMGFLKDSPEKYRQVQQLMDYSLPTTIRLLRKYEDLSRQPVKGATINDSMQKIKEMSDMVAKTFSRELDSLYKDQALDIEVDIEVMQNMLQQQSMELTMGKVADDFNTPLS